MLTATIHAEFGVSDREIMATEVGLLSTFNQTGLRMAVRALRLPSTEPFPTLPNGQVSDAVIAGHPLWDGGGPNVWLTSRDLTHFDQSTNFIYSVGSEDGHMAISSARLDLTNKDEPLQLLTTSPTKLDIWLDWSTSTLQGMIRNTDLQVTARMTVRCKLAMAFPTPNVALYV